MKPPFSVQLGSNPHFGHSVFKKKKKGLIRLNSDSTAVGHIGKDFNF